VIFELRLKGDAFPIKMGADGLIGMKAGRELLELTDNFKIGVFEVPPVHF
jgi:hypothetical protein